MENMINFDGYNDMPSSEEIKYINSSIFNNNMKENCMVNFYINKTIYVDDWISNEEDLIFKHADKKIILPVAEYYGLKTDKLCELDCFIISPKRCYNRPEMRIHTTHYLNYFEKFYDPEHELLIVYYQLKYIMDFNKEYNKTNFISDLNKYIIHNRSILKKLFIMNEDNYLIPLKAKKGRSVKSLQYTTRHGKILMQMSMLMNMVLPLITHFVHLKNIDNIDGTLLEIFDEILDLSDVDMYNKLYETSISEVKRNQNVHTPLWNMQDIRGKNVTTHAMASIENIILNIMPKYCYNQNVISFNFISIRKNTRYKITDIKYEFNFTLLSSSNRDEDFNSDFDKFESYLIKQNEALYLQNKVNCQETMNEIEKQFGPFDYDEIDFCINALEENGTNIINGFQKDLIFNLFYKYFGDPVSINAINRIDYIKLMISAKRILEVYNMVILPYIISSKVIRIPNRKSVNKKELTKLESSPLWQQIKDKYRNPKIEEYILGQIAIILSSEFKIIDYDDEYLNSKIIECIPDIVCEEFMIFVLMI